MGIWIPVIIPIPHEWLCFPSRPWHLKAAVFGQKAHNFAINISCKPVANTRPNKLLDAAGETCQGIGLGEHIISTWNIWGLYTVRSETCCEVLVDFVLEGGSRVFSKTNLSQETWLGDQESPSSSCLSLPHEAKTVGLISQDWTGCWSRWQASLFIFINLGEKHIYVWKILKACGIRAIL